MVKAKSVHIAALTILVWASLLSACAEMGGQKASEPQVRERSFSVMVIATVKAVDIAKRELTLMLPEGRVVTLEVDPRVKRLAEIKTGDKVRAEYFIALAAEVREPTAAEMASPLEAVGGEIKAPPSGAPAGVVLHQVQAVVTVVAIDMPGSKVVVKGPRGNHLEIAVEDQKLLNRLHLGQRAMLTFTEALALSVEKVE